jgi:hypothetical protein
LKTRIVYTLILGALAFGPASAYETRYVEPDSEGEIWSMERVAEAMGYSSVRVPPETWICRDAEGGRMNCIALPPGTMLLFPAEPDTVGVR